MSSTHIGLICLFLFATSQGVRDAYFGNVFQSVSFFFVAVMAFGLSSVVFIAWSRVRRPGDLRRIAERPGTLVALNATTAAAWLSFFYGLRHLEPAVVATMFNGIAPLIVLIGSRGFGWTSAKARLTATEKLLFAGLGASLAALALVVLGEQSGMPGREITTQAAALAAVAFGGMMITTSYIFARAYTDTGVGSDAVMGARFLLTLAIAAAAETAVGTPAGRPDTAQIPSLALITFLLIVVPSFLVQYGVSRTSPLVAHVFRALAPVFVFAVQQIDGRLRFSGATLACIVAFCAFTIAASSIGGWREARARPARDSET